MVKHNWKYEFKRVCRDFLGKEKADEIINEVISSSEPGTHPDILYERAWKKMIAKI